MFVFVSFSSCRRSAFQEFPDLLSYGRNYLDLNGPSKTLSESFRRSLSSAISNLAQGMLSLVSDYGNEVRENFAHVYLPAQNGPSKIPSESFLRSLGLSRACNFSGSNS